MMTHLRSALPRVAALLAAALLSLAGCSQQPSAGSSAQAGKTAPPAAAGPGAAPASGVVPPLEPPDGKWLVDDQGREYFVSEVEKEKEGQYLWLNDEKTQVRLWYGAQYDVVGHDEDSFQVKIYRVAAAEPPKSKEPTADELAKIAASYRVETKAVDRLTLESFGAGLPAEGQWRNGFKIADMNGDGHLDIVHGPARKGLKRPNIFLGDSRGNWRRWAEAQFPPLPYDYGDVAVADFNADGRPDLAFAIHLTGLVVLVAEEGGKFREWSKGIDFKGTGTESGFSSRTVEAADWNGDGRVDLIAFGEGPQMAGAGRPGQQVRPGGGGYGLVVYLNQGDGSWTRQGEGEQAKLFGDDLEVVDFTNDGHLDIVLGSSVLGAKDLLRIGSGGSWQVARLDLLRPASLVGAVDAADFDGDRRIDLVLGYMAREGGVWRTGIDLLVATASGGWERRPLYAAEGRKWLTALASGEVDGDGRRDLAALTGDGETLLFLGRGDGSFQREESPEVPVMTGGCKGFDVKIADLDGRPGGEVVTAFAGEASALFAPERCLSEGAMAAWRARPKGRG